MQLHFSTKNLLIVLPYICKLKAYFFLCLGLLVSVAEAELATEVLDVATFNCLDTPFVVPLQ